MIRPALFFLLIALIAGVFGFGMFTDVWALVTQLLCAVFLILFFVTLGTPLEVRTKL